MDLERRLELVMSGVEEVITESELKERLQAKEMPRAYVGYEPSGFVHIGWLIITKKIEQLIEAGFQVDILLADWHAFINDKFGGDLDKIKACGEYIMDCYKAYGLGTAIDSGRLRFVWASDMADSAKYWERVLRVAKASTLSRIRRSMTIMGRKEDEGDLDSSKFLYPSMQAADIFELEVDVAIGGMDQRHAHMLARDVADKKGWVKPVALHTPLLSSLSRSGRMEMVTGPTGGLDYPALASKVEVDLALLMVNQTLSAETRALLDGLKKDMDVEKRRKALEVLLAGRRRVGGKTPIYSLLQKDDAENGSVTTVLAKDLERQMALARKELFEYLGVSEEQEGAVPKMSKSDPDSGIYLHDREQDILRKLNKAWCPEGVPDNPVMEICQTIIFPYRGTLDIKRPEKWGGDLHFTEYEALRAAFATKQLHPADLKKSVGKDLIEVLRPYREYFEANPGTLKKVGELSASIGR
ncbi:MAG: tyrosine--tRNA ligase [Candidatus Thermoplasmatota archaeon]|jgi:tyrosyl-tRNA synthetase|nr:tyrosine--tRNA ligase [Candidatus Thermoplasmatota archaeon]